MKDQLLQRFTTYARIDTQSDSSNSTCPSTEGQWTLARVLEAELTALGMEEVSVDSNGYVMATLPATDSTADELPVIGFLAHMDTATDFTGAGVNPQVHRYEGGDIVLNEALGITLSPREFPELEQYKGHTLVTTDGTTLLGADNKAGVAEIMVAMEYLLAHPEIKHGKIRVGFTPDEEIGRGPHRFDVAAFGADFAYTMDGGPLGELQYESFNAAAVQITIRGKNVHPGTAKGKMVHAGKIAMELCGKLPAAEAPEYTEGYEGFYHLISLQATVEEAKLYYLIRDFDRSSFAERKEVFQGIAWELNSKYGEHAVSLKIEDQYFNMREKIEPVQEIVELARQAMLNLGITPLIQPIRGGTDGSQLSYMGLPTPNIFTGGENYHGRYEYISLDNMELAVRTIIELVRLSGEKGALSGASRQ